MSTDFLYHLYRGEEALRADDLEQARASLEQAFRVRPEHEKSLSLLGIVYYRLGLFYRAAEIYRRLIQLNPGDPVLRVNQALSLMRLDRRGEAREALEVCLSLASDNRRAHSFLGLLLSYEHRLEEARDHFQSAGQEEMVTEMETRIARGRDEGRPSLVRELSIEDVDDRPEPVVGYRKASGETWGWRDDDREAAAGVEPEPVTKDQIREEFVPVGSSGDAPEVEIIPADQQPEEAVELGGAELEGETEVVTESEPETQFEPGTVRGQAIEPEADLDSSDEAEDEFDAAAEGEVGKAAGDEAPPEPRPEPTSTLADAPQVMVSVDGADEAVGHARVDAFQPLPGGVLRVIVDDQVHLRRSGLLSLVGELALEVEGRRVRGQASEGSLGDEADPILKVSGSGHVLVGAGKRRLNVYRFDPGVVFLREELVFGFDRGFTFENGTVPGRGEAPDLDLVQFAGQGMIAMATPGKIVTLQIEREHPVRARWGAVVGWSGELLPRVRRIELEGAERPPAVIELKGEGRVFLAVEEIGGEIA